MNILIVMIPLSILLLIGAGIAFFWAVDNDQFDDMETPALLPLEDSDKPREAVAGVGDVSNKDARKDFTEVSH